MAKNYGLPKYCPKCGSDYIIVGNPTCYCFNCKHSWDRKEDK